MIRALQRAGFEVIRQKGSHVLLVHPATGKRCTVPQHVGELKVGTTAGILRTSGISAEEFRELLGGRR